MKKESPKHVNLTSHEFLDKIFAESGTYKHSHYFYYAQSVSLDLPSDIIKDILPNDQFIVKEKWNANATEPSKSLVWIGEANVTTHLHHDWSHNFHVQIKGRKQFLLFPPSQWRYLYLYPFLHPHGTKCQVNPDDVDFARFPQARNARGYVVELEAGEALYIPPLWFHHVKSLENSISVSMWSSTAESSLMKQLMAEGVPFSSDWDDEQKTFACLLFTKQVVIAVKSLDQDLGMGEEEGNDVPLGEDEDEEDYALAYLALVTKGDSIFL
eukprot:TRINITY_DN222_c0_g1_i2.p1 TRINITY_DN222_c0_g1~~TRINITY_DN222_c0_g1_i2.p1  ORF type:complete len:269 (-),score=31.37 TRINITY_DN222_c0_g1_i2:317-1123(-)